MSTPGAPIRPDDSGPVAEPGQPHIPEGSPTSSVSAPAGGGISDLRRRRDELAAQVTELHWDLGGLAYEMAIRDHFRLDVLLRRAALLQERDADLAEVEQLLRMEESAAGGGDSSGSPPPGSFPLGSTPPGSPPPGSPPPGSPPGALPPVAPPAGPTRPPFGIAALLLLVFLGFGALLGGVSGSPAGGALAASARPHLKLVLPPAAPAASTSSSPPAREPPPSTPESSPSASEESSTEPAEADSSTPASTSPSGSGKHSSASGSSGSGSTGSGGGSSGSNGSGSSDSNGSGSSGSSSGGGSASGLPPVKHVFVIMLSDEPYATVFGPSSTAPYLSRTLEKRGELLVRYYAVAHEELANEIALISGQGPTAETAANCATYADIAPATVGAHQQVAGHGCVYPRATQTLAGQLSAKHHTWRAYLQGMGEGAGQPTACGHPALGAPDPTEAAQPPAGQPYATFRNPFVYFHSVIDSPACAADDVSLSKLSGDLASAKRTPSFSYIVPDRCHDGSPTPCAPAAPAGMPAADGFLKKVVPEIMRSKAYKDGGLLLITVDEAPTTGEFADSSSCCEQSRFSNLPPSVQTPIAGLPPNGGGQVGALLLSPYVKPATTNQEPFNDFSLLRTVENLFGLGHLGYASLSKLEAFGAAVFNAGT